MSGEEVASRFLNLMLPDLFANAIPAEEPKPATRMQPKEERREPRREERRESRFEAGDDREERRPPRPQRFQKFGEKKFGDKKFQDKEKFGALKFQPAYGEKPRWKKDRAERPAPAFSGEQRQRREEPRAPFSGVAGGSAKPKKKFGYWKSKKDGGSYPARKES
jgi:hypothetical protein